MNMKQLLKKSLLLSLLAIIPMVVQAADQLTFTWKGSTSVKSFLVTFSLQNKPITIDWGDGKGPQSYTSEAGKNYGIKYANTDEYTVTVTSVYCNITQLMVEDKNITALDISKCPLISVVWCSGNSISELDLSKNTAMTYLTCNNNKLTSLDISKLTELLYLYAENNSIPSLNPTKCTKLKDLRIHNNLITSLDVSKNTQLEFLSCYNNSIGSLDVSKNIKLTYLNFRGSSIRTIDVSKNTALTTLNCSNNSLSTIDVTKNTALIEFYCNGNSFKNLDISKNTVLTDLSCGDNPLTSIDLSKNTALRTLRCNNNSLTELNIAVLTKLRVLYCQNNFLTNIDLSKNTVLQEIHCQENLLTTLDVSRNTILSRLECHTNLLTELNASNSSIKYLTCYSNQLSTLLFPTSLISLYCGSNRLSLSTLYAGYRTGASNMPSLGVQTHETEYMQEGNASFSLAGEMTINGVQTSFDITKNGVKAIEGTDYVLDYGKENITFLNQGEYSVMMASGSILNSISNCYVIKTFNVIKNETITYAWTGSSKVKSIKLAATSGKGFTIDWGNGSGAKTYTGTGEMQQYDQPSAYGNENTYTVTITGTAGCSFSELDMLESGVTSINISQSPNLTMLNCSYNALTTLDVSKNPKLRALSCVGNKLTGLDVTKNIKLDEFYCSYNLLTELNVGNNMNLESMDCTSNLLTKLDITRNFKLNNLYCSNNLLSELDITVSVKLNYLDCSNNSITSLDFRGKNNLTNLNTHENSLPLSVLYAASVLPKLTDRVMGTQTFEPQNIDYSIPYSLKGEMAIGGNQTAFSVIRGGENAVLNTDYKLDYTNETITFLTGGDFEVTMTNSAIASNADYPAKIIIPFKVKGPDQIILQWKGSMTSSKALYIKATNEKKFTIDWGNGTKENATGIGSKTGYSKRYNSSNVFTVTITGEYGCDFTIFDVHDQEMLSLDLTAVPLLNYLHCNGNNLVTLDLSKNIELEVLYCYANQLTSLDVASPLLNFLACFSNQLESLDLTRNAKLMNLQCYNNKLKELNTTGLETLATMYCQNNELVSLDVPTTISILNCANNKLEELDLSNCSYLSSLICNSNKLTSLNIARSTPRDGTTCYDNQLSLNTLHTIQTYMSSYNPKNFGTQTYETQKAFKNNAFSLRGNMKVGSFGGVNSNIVVKKEGNTAVENTDYSLDFSAQTITFFTTGSYELTITNTAITSSAEYPAMVIMPVEVVLGNAIDEVQAATLSIYPNPVTDILNINYAGLQIDYLEIVDMNGQIVMRENNLTGESIPVAHLPKGIYLLRTTIDGKSIVSKFTKR